MNKETQNGCFGCIGLITLGQCYFLATATYTAFSKGLDDVDLKMVGLSLGWFVFAGIVLFTLSAVGQTSNNSSSSVAPQRPSYSSGGSTGSSSSTTSYSPSSTDKYSDLRKRAMEGDSAAFLSLPDDEMRKVVDELNKNS